MKHLKTGMNAGSAFFLLSLAFIFTAKNTYAANYTVNTYSAFTTAIGSASDGDTISFTAHIVVSAEVALSKSLVLNGNGYTITVPVPGLSNAGTFNSSASTFRVFNLSGNKTIIFNRLTIMGGATTASGAAIAIASGTTAKFNQCTITNSRVSGSSGGGGIYNLGSCYLYKSFITRNAAFYGGGFLNSGAAASLFLEYSTVTENRSLATNGGGGGGENNSSAKLYVNNTSFSNNQSTELGGAINNIATAYIVNSSFTGNVVYGTYKGGAIAQNSGTPMVLINCLFGYNYYKSAPTSSSAPTTLSLNDIEAYSGTVNLYYSTFMTSSTTSGTISSVIGNSTHAIAANGSTNDLFTGGSLGSIFDANGNVYGTATCFQPLLVNINGMRVPTLKTGSYALGKGCVVGFTNGNGSPVIGYKNMSNNTWTTLVGSGAASYVINDDETFLSRAATPAAGALERMVDNYYILKVNNAANGTVDGATIYGEVYPAGTPVSITALASTGYAFNNWTYNQGGSGTVATNPLSIVLNANTTLTPSFVSSTNYTVTYLGNGNNAGTTPGINAYPSGNNATIAGNSGNLAKTGFTFAGWNTLDNGSGTNYTQGASYTGNSNLILYAKWESNGTVLGIKLLSFEAYTGSGQWVDLKWETATETNNDYFEVQRSQDGIKWEGVQRVKGAGTTAQRSAYSLQDMQPFTGKSFYRLKQVDFDGTSYVSPVRSVNLEQNNGDLAVYPNPAKDYFHIKRGNMNEKDFKVINNMGQNVTGRFSLEKISDKVWKIRCGNVPPGLYYINTPAGYRRLTVVRED